MVLLGGLGADLWAIILHRLPSMLDLARVQGSCAFLRGVVASRVLWPAFITRHCQSIGKVLLMRYSEHPDVYFDGEFDPFLSSTSDPLYLSSYVHAVFNCEVFDDFQKDRVMSNFCERLGVYFTGGNMSQLMLNDEQLPFHHLTLAGLGSTDTVFSSPRRAAFGLFSGRQISDMPTNLSADRQRPTVRVHNLKTTDAQWGFVFCGWNLKVVATDLVAKGMRFGFYIFDGVDASLSNSSAIDCRSPMRMGSASSVTVRGCHTEGSRYAPYHIDIPIGFGSYYEISRCSGVHPGGSFFVINTPHTFAARDTSVTIRDNVVDSKRGIYIHSSAEPCDEWCQFRSHQGITDEFSAHLQITFHANRFASLQGDIISVKGRQLGLSFVATANSCLSARGSICNVRGRHRDETLQKITVQGNNFRNTRDDIGAGPVIQKLLDGGKCTYVQTEDDYLYQPWYKCLTCFKTDKNLGCCQSCAEVCHANHDVYLDSVLSHCFCDCQEKGRCIL